MATLKNLKGLSEEIGSNLVSYIQKLKKEELRMCYGDSAICLAVFRELPTLAKQFVLRMLFLNQAVSKAVINSWTNLEHQRESESVIASLDEMMIWETVNLPGGMSGITLSQLFRQNLQVALLGGGKRWIGAGELQPDKNPKDIASLDQYARQRWECLLHCLAGSSGGTTGVTKDIRDVLEHSGLIRCKGDDTEITAAGFQFLLMGRKNQVWQFLRLYLDTAEPRSMSRVEILSLLFQLSYCTLGEDYSTDFMTESQLRILQHLREIGLIYQKRRKSGRFYTTVLTGYLSAAADDEDDDKDDSCFIMVDTNYRIHAYTESELQVAQLALFTDITYRFNNMVTGLLTREKVRVALQHGITANQIIRFLRVHAHPDMRHKTPLLPPTITDQLRLWELELDRFHFSEGVLYNQFISDPDFTRLRDYADSLGVLMWQKPGNRTMVVTKSGHDDVKKYWKRHKNS